MNITLDNFQDYIPSKIYWRGVDYYESGAVTRLHEKPNGTWHASVEGSEDYTVNIRIKQGSIMSWSCDCPYDGTMCKHVVATLLEIINRAIDEEDDLDIVDELDNEELDYEGAEVDKNGTAQSEDLELDSLLSLATINDFTSFIRQRAKDDNSLRQAVIEYLRSLYLNEPNSVAIDYEQKVDSEISSCVFTHRGRYENYEESDWSEIVDRAHDLLTEGENLLKAGNARAAVAIALQLFKSMDQMADESVAYEEDSDIGGVCDRASELLLEAIVKPDVDTELRNKVLEGIQRLTSSELDTYEYCDFDGLLQQLTTRTLHGDDAITFIDHMIASHAGDYSRLGYIMRKIELLNQLGRHDDAERTIDEHLDEPEIRLLRVNQLVANKRYQDALRVVDQGIVIAQSKEHMGTVQDWKEKMLEINENTGNVAEQIKIARELFLNKNALEYYHKLKDLVPSEDWPKYLTELLQEAGLVINGCEHYILAQILIEEGDTEGLFHYVSQMKFNRLDSIIKYAVHLRETHAKQLFTLLQESIREYAAANVGESHYRKLADALRVMRSLPNCRAAASALCTELCTTYRRRRRMVEILSRV